MLIFLGILFLAVAGGVLWEALRTNDNSSLIVSGMMSFISIAFTIKSFGGV